MQRKKGFFENLKDTLFGTPKGVRPVGGVHAAPAQAAAPVDVTVALVGDAGVGKSSIINRLINDQFNDSFITSPVQGAIMTSKGKLSFRDGDESHESRWGRDASATRAKGNLNGVNAVVVCFDVTDAQSFNGVQRWLEQVRKFAPDDASLLLVGTKSDLGDERKVKSVEAEALADKYGLTYLEVSARASTNINAITQWVSDEVVPRVEAQGVKLGF